MEGERSEKQGKSEYVALAENLLETARKQLKEDGGLVPVTFIVDRADQLHILGTPFTGDTPEEVVESKDVLSAVVRQFCRECGAKAVISIMEAWVYPSSWSKEQVQDAVRRLVQPSPLPDREEVVFVTVETRQGRWQAILPIRREGKAGYVGEAEWMDGSDAVITGRFSHYLPENDVVDRLLGPTPGLLAGNNEWQNE